jgi:NADPH:quinone reductase-like Zn-dependent oxidoreductase
VLGSIGRGSYAEYVLVRPNEAAPKPARLSYIEAAAVPLAALTAWQGLFDHGQLEAGQTVLIHGGSGGVSHFAIQFAKIKGATVLTTVSPQTSTLSANSAPTGRSTTPPSVSRRSRLMLIWSWTSWAEKPRSGPGRC